MSAWHACLHGTRGALQWRLLLLWMLGLLLPTAVVALPLWRALAEMFDHVLPASAWAQRFNGLELDGFAALLEHAGALHGAGLAGTLLALGLSPWLTGMVIVGARNPEHLGFTALIVGGLREYGRMLRVMLWAMLPLAVALLVALIAVATAYNHAATAVLEAQADAAYRLAWWIVGSVLVLFHLVIESGRAQFAAAGDQRSAWKALERGFGMLLRRPFASLSVYLSTSVIGYALLLGLIAWRVQVIAASLPAFIGACLLVQLMVLVLAWMRSARLLGLAALA